MHMYFNQACPRCEQSGKVEYKRERLAGNRQKINEFLSDSQQAFRARIRLFRFALEQYRWCTAISIEVISRTHTRKHTQTLSFVNYITSNI